MADHIPRKRFGQNFLCDENIIDEIVNLIAPQPFDHIVEIGPGLGALTLPLLPLVAKIDAIELDRDLIPRLKNKAKHFENLFLHQQDALKFDFTLLTQKNKSLRVIGNLPYNISTPLLFHLFNQKEVIIDMHFMLQKEVANRLMAKTSTKDYGRLTVMTQYHCQVEDVLDVPPQAFNPIPKVDSKIVRLIPKQPSRIATNILLLEELVKHAFSMRRKTIRNSLKNFVAQEKLIQANIDPGKRAEELSVDNFVELSNILAG